MTNNNDNADRINPGLFGIRITPIAQAVIVFLAIAGVGSGGGFIGRFVFGGNANAGTNVSKDSHEVLNVKVQGIEAKLTAQDARIEKVSKDVSSILLSQRKDVAREEARRVTEKISNRARRETAYDYLRRKNLARLENGKEPCIDIDCAER